MTSRRGDILIYLKDATRVNWANTLLAPVAEESNSTYIISSWSKLKAVLASRKVRSCALFVCDQENVDHIMEDLSMAFGDNAMPVVFIQMTPDIDFSSYRKSIQFEVLEAPSASPMKMMAAMEAAERVYEVCSAADPTATQDPLTGLISRDVLLHRLEHSFTRCKRYGERCTLLCINLNQLTSVNEKYGHAVGDKLLVEMASRLRNKCRKTDSVARLNGDEFVVLLENVDMTVGQTVAAKIKKYLSVPYDLGDAKIHVSLSVGMASYPDTAKDAHELLAQVGQTLTKAKDHEEIHLVNVTTTDKDQLYRRQVIEMELGSAIENDELQLAYQPIVCADTFQVKRVEAQSRWPREGLKISSIELMEAIDRLSLTEVFHEWLFSTAFKQMELWQNEAVAPDICLNVPANYCYSQTISDAALNYLHKHNVEPSQVELEITESTLMRYPERSVKVLSHLHAEGLRIAVDDFGTGFSCMSYLTSLPIDTLKIDKDFFLVQKNQVRNRKVVEAITALGHSLGQKVIAEGVETEVQLTMARDAGCDLLQGFYFGKPQLASTNWHNYASQFAHVSNPIRKVG